MSARSLSAHMIARLFLIALLATVSSPVTAKDYTLGDLKIEQPRARVTIPGRPAAGYMMIKNAGSEVDAIVSASSPMAERVELHTHLTENGVMKMRPVKKVDVPARGNVAFKSGGFHLMIFGLKGKMKDGDALPITLVFEKAGLLETEFAVETIGGRKKKSDSRSGHGAHKH